MRNTQSIPHKTNWRSVPVLLAIGLAILLTLIGFIGFLAVRKLSELRDEANSRRREYNHRLQLAVELRAEVDTVIAEVRLHRGFRDGGVRGTPTRIKLSEAKLRLEKLLNDSQKLLAGKGEALPSVERAAWQRVQAAGAVFWQCLAEEEKRPPDRSKTEPSQTANQASATAPAATTPIPAADTKPAPDFFKCREELSKAAQELSNVMVAGESSISTDLTLLQDRAAREVKTALWSTLLVGVFVTLLTIALTRRQLREIRSATQQAQHAEGLTNSVFNSLTSGVLAINEQGGLLKSNQAFRKQFKLSAAELTLQDYRAALAPLPEISAFVERTLHNHQLAEGQRERIEIKPGAGHETTQLLDVSVAPLTVGEEEHGRVVVLDDVTEAEKTREELRRNRTLSTVGQLTAQVAHEIYNPLGALKLNVELLEMQVNGDKDAQSTVGRLKRGLEHLSTIVMDLRYLTRPREPERKPTDLNALLDEAVELAGDRLERSHIFVKRSYAPERLVGDYDPLQLRKVFLNLLINALEASPRAGEVELLTRRTTAPGANDALLAVSVIDHGVGMSTETKRRIFEAFYSTKQHGTGLGMMITQEIIKKHEGRIEIESEEGKGTTVTVYLPG